jgi:CheY-like chemotaxis protein
VPATAPARAPAAGGALRVLLVDDEPELREIAQQMLELLGCAEQAEGSAEAAERALREGSFDLLLTDLSLPGRNGVQLAQAARTLQPALRVVLSSGYGHAHAEPGMWTLPKPYGLPELEGLLERVREAA